MIVIILLIILVLVLMYLTVMSMLASGGSSKSKSGRRKAGQKAEEFVTNIISEVMDDDDVLLANVEIEYEGRRTELDNVLINRKGVFIIETKNYKGDLYGSEDDDVWIKQKTSSSGALYEEEVRNPIRQVKREIDILARYLRDNGISVWVDGYVYLVHRNSPVDSEYILWNRRDIEYVIHPNTKYQLTSKQVNRVEKLLP